MWGLLNGADGKDKERDRRIDVAAIPVETPVASVYFA
jgi:hypothetical protein